MIEIHDLRQEAGPPVKGVTLFTFVFFENKRERKQTEILTGTQTGRQIETATDKR